MIDRKLQKYYEERFSMIATQGWKDLMEDIDTRIKSIESIKGIKTIESLYTRQGELDALEWIKSLHALSTRAYEELKDEGIV